MALLSLIVDSREPALIQKLRFGGVDKAIAPLDGGDLLGVCDDGALLAVERKTPSDLLSTLRSQRLFPQLVKLREQSPFAYLVITGGLYPAANDTCWTEEPGMAAGTRETGWRWSDVQGALLTCQEIGVHVVFAHGDLDYEGTVLRLGNRDRSAKRVAPARLTEAIDDREAFLAGIPGIGPERAQALLAACGSPAWALHALTEHTTQTRLAGIGPKTREYSRRFLGLHDDEELSPVIWRPDDLLAAPKRHESPALVEATA